MVGFPSLTQKIFILLEKVSNFVLFLRSIYMYDTMEESDKIKCGRGLLVEIADSEPVTYSRLTYEDMVKFMNDVFYSTPVSPNLRGSQQAGEDYGKDDWVKGLSDEWR